MSDSPTLDTLYFLVPPEVQLLDITGPAHIFYEAKTYGLDYNTVFLSLTKTKESVSCTGLLLSNLEYFERYSLTQNDVLFIPGMEPHLIFNSDFKDTHQNFFNWLNQQYKNGARLRSVCTGAYFLAYANLFNGKKCTTHWKYLNDFEERFPQAQLLKNRLIIRDGNIYSSAGVSAGIDLSLFILEEIYGAVFASKIAKEVVIYLRRTENDPQLSEFLQHRNHIDTRIHQVQDIISQNLANKINIIELAQKVHMSPRNLTRLFKKATGLTLGVYLERLRIELAQKLLNQGEKVESTANAIGLKSTNQLRNLFKKHLLKLPSNHTF